MKIFIEPLFEQYYQKHPLVLVDIGASGGLESNWKSAERYLQIIGFEPDEREFHNLEKKENGKTKYLNTGLYNIKSTFDYYLTGKQQTSSMIKPNRVFLDQFPEAERFDIVKKVTIETDTLDNQFKVNDIKDADFIKVDTQGTELFILEGAQETIQEHVFGLEIEVEFAQMYQDQPLFSDVDQFVRKQGFQLFDIQGAYWKRSKGRASYKKRGQLVFGNALYLRDLEDFEKIISRIEGEAEKKGKILKAISICFLYGYYDYALDLIDRLGKFFSGDECQEIQDKIKRTVHFANCLPNFKGKKMLADILYSLWEFIRPTHNQWATIDRKLGNL